MASETTQGILEELNAFKAKILLQKATITNKDELDELEEYESSHTILFADRYFIRCFLFTSRILKVWDDKAKKRKEKAGLKKLKKLNELKSS